MSTTPSITHSSSGRTSGSAASLTVNHVSDGLPLIVIVNMFANTSIPLDIGTCTFNGTAMKYNGAFGKNSSNSIWAIFTSLAPATTTANIVYTPASNYFMNLMGLNLDDWYGYFMAVVDGGSSTTPSIAVPGTSGDLIIGYVGSDVSSQVFTEDGSQTVIFEQEAAGGDQFGAASYKTSSGSSTTMSYTLGTSDQWGMLGLALTSGASNVSTGGEDVSFSA